MIQKTTMFQRTLISARNRWMCCEGITVGLELPEAAVNRRHNV